MPKLTLTGFLKNVLQKRNRSINHNGLAMKSSGIETFNYQMRTKLNRIINLTVSTATAIFL